MALPYARRTWADSPSTSTPISAANLNAMELGIQDLSDAFTGHVGEVRASGGDISTMAGSPTLSSVTALWPAWLMDAGSNESVGALFRVPSYWLTFDILFECVNAGAGSGNHVLRTVYAFRGSGDDISTVVTGSPVTTAAVALNIVQYVTLASGVSVTAGKPLMVRADRRASDGADTLANDLGISAIIIRRAS